MQEPRTLHTATLLRDGKVLVAGGARHPVPPNDEAFALDSAEVYDPASGTWGPAAAMTAPRSGHTATILPDNRILVVGGRGSAEKLIDANIHRTAEIYDPKDGAWYPSASMLGKRYDHTATLIEGSFSQCGHRCGRVIVTGGCCFGDESYGRDDAEIYTPEGHRVMVPPPSRREVRELAEELPGVVKPVEPLRRATEPQLQTPGRGTEPQLPGTTAGASSPARRRATTPPRERAGAATQATASKTTAGPSAIQLQPGANPQRTGVPEKSRSPSVRATGQDPALPTWLKVLAGASTAALLVAIVAYMIHGRVVSNLSRRKHPRLFD